MNRSEKTARGTAEVCAQNTIDHEVKLLAPFCGRVDTAAANEGGPESTAGAAGSLLDAVLDLLAERIAGRLAPLVGAPKPHYADGSNNPFGSERAFLEAARRGDFHTFPRCRRVTALWSDVERSIESRQRKRKTPAPQVSAADADRAELEAAGVRLRPERRVRR